MFSPVIPIVILDADAGSGYIYSSQYAQVLSWAAANGATAPAYDYDKIQEDIMVRALVDSGIWAQSDQIFNFSTTGDKAFSLINLKSPGTLNASYSASQPDFLPGRGFSANAAGPYVNTNYIPSSSATNFTQNNAGIFVHIDSSDPGNTSETDFGAAGAATLHGISLVSRNSSNGTLVRLNEATAMIVSSPPSTDTFGNWAISRSASNVIKLFHNETQIGATLTQASTGLCTVSIALGGYNSNGSVITQSIKVYSFYLIGANLDSYISTLGTIVNTYLAARQVINTVSFPNRDNITDYISSISQLSSNFTYSPPAQELIKGTVPTGGGYQAAALASNDCIYFGVGSGTSFLKVNTITKVVSSFGTVAVGSLKYGAIVHVNGFCYLIPSNSTVVTKINTSNDSVTYFDSSGVKGTESGNLTGTTKWYGGFIGVDGKIYCLPYTATSILIIDPTTDAITFMDFSGIIGSISGNMTGTQKWDTGIKYGRYIYGTPSDTTTILKIDTQTQTCSTFGTFPAGTAKWSLTAIGSNGYIYMFPYFSNNIIKLDPSNDTYSYLSTTIGSVDSNEKVFACNVMPDGGILLVMAGVIYPNNYMFNPNNDSLTPFARIDTSIVSCGGALAKDGSYYGCPLSSSRVVRFFYPKRTISLDDDFIFNQHIHGF